MCVRLHHARVYALTIHHTHVRLMIWVGQNLIYTVHIPYMWQGNHQIYGHIRCVHTVLANPAHDPRLVIYNHTSRSYKTVITVLNHVGISGICKGVALIHFSLLFFFHKLDPLRNHRPRFHHRRPCVLHFSLLFFFISWTPCAITGPASITDGRVCFRRKSLDMVA